MMPVHHQIDLNLKLARSLVPKQFDAYLKNQNTLFKPSADRYVWTQQVRSIKGQPWSFEGRKYLEKLYRDDSQEINIVKSRQMEITEFLLNWLLSHLTTHPYTVGLYMSDRQDHVSVFSKLRLQSGAISTSKYLRSMALETEHNVSWQPFANGSHLYMFSAWGDFEAARSIPVDFAAVDEMQSVNVEALPVLKESMSKSNFKKILKAGTGSDEGDGWFDEWHRGTQWIWDPNVLDKNNSPGDWVQMPGTPLNPKVNSYRINQFMAPWISQSELDYKFKTYTPRRFENEVAGWWFKGMRRPLLAKEIQALFDRNISFTPSSEVDDGWPIFMGIDLGGGTSAYTVAWIWQLINKDAPRFKVLNITKMTESSTEKQADMLAELITKYKVHQVVSDAGGGARQVEKLSNRFKSRFFKCHYRYDSNNPYEVINSELRVNVDRTWIIETIIDLIKRPQDHPDVPQGIPRVQIPYADPEKVEWIIDHFTCIEAETATANGREYVRYIHGDETNDDAFHAMCYAYVAYRIWMKNQFWYKGVA